MFPYLLCTDSEIRSSFNAFFRSRLLLMLLLMNCFNENVPLRVLFSFTIEIPLLPSSFSLYSLFSRIWARLHQDQNVHTHPLFSACNFLSIEHPRYCEPYPNVKSAWHCSLLHINRIIHDQLEKTPLLNSIVIY